MRSLVRLDPTTTATRHTARPRWALAILAAVLAVAVGLFAAGPASAATAATARNAVGASTFAGQVAVEFSASISAGQRLGNDPLQPQMVVATGVAANTAGEVATVAPRVVHGNSASSPATAYLYRLSSTETGYLKTGISQNPMTRYSQTFMQDKTMEMAVSPKDVPIDVIVRDGNSLILNTRSSQALIRAGFPRSSWNVIDRTGQAAFEARLSGQLGRNGLTSYGTDLP